MDNRFGGTAEDPLDPKRKIFNALAGPGDDPLQQPGPVGGGVEVGAGLPKPIPGDQVSGPAVSGPQPSRDFSRLEGYDINKLSDPNHKSYGHAKSGIGRTLAGFDSTQGLTPEVIAALNGLGFGTFSGQGDKLSLSGLTDAGRKAGLVGDYKDADFNKGFKTGNGKWVYADPAAEAMQGGGGATGGGSLDALLAGGDPMAKIQAAIAQLSGPRSNAQALLEALR